MDVLLVRHGRAGVSDRDRWPDDNDRPLTSDGVRRMIGIARGLANGPKPERVLASGSRRTWHTAQILHQHAGWPEPEESKRLNDGSDASKMTNKLQKLHEKGVRSVALVGHEPHLSSLAGYMITGEPNNRGSKLKKGGAAYVQYHSQPGSGELQWMMPGKALAKLNTVAKFNRAVERVGV